MRKLLVGLISCLIIFSITACGNSFKEGVEQGYEDAINENSSNEEKNALEVDGEKSSDTIEIIENDGIVDKLISFGFTEEEADEQRKILLQCGILSIDICEPTDENATIDGLISFRGKIDEDRIFWFTVENRKIFYIALNGEDLYDEDKGGFIKTFDEVHIPETYVSQEDKIKLRDMAESILEKYFLASYDVRYYDAWAVGRKDDLYMTRCEISDGSILTDGWILGYVWFEKQDGEYVATGIEIDGQQYELK